MASRIVRTEADRDLAATWIANMKPPFVLSATKGSIRSAEQNRLQRLWCREVADQVEDMTEEQVRGFCKAWFGIPIRMEDPVFAEVYDRLIKPKTYEEKLEMMMVPLDLPVTRDMTTKDKARYLDAMWEYWTARGVRLTDPEPLGAAA